MYVQLAYKGEHGPCFDRPSLETKKNHAQTAGGLGRVSRPGLLAKSSAANSLYMTLFTGSVKKHVKPRHLARNHLNQHYNNLDDFLTSTVASLGTREVNSPTILLQPLHNCTYSYDHSSEEDNQLIGTVSLYMDGPLTLLGALLAFIGCHFAVKFLGTAGLNKDLTAALYALCLCDAFLIFMVVLYHSLEATGILITGRNVMWKEQDLVLCTHGIVSAATTASTLLVVFITFQRFLVVMFPMRYARSKAMHIPVRRISVRQSVSSLEDLEVSNGLFTRNVSKQFFHRKSPSLRKLIRPFIFPVSVVAFAVVINITVFFEFELVECFAVAQQRISTHLYPTALRQSQTYNLLRTVIMMITQTVGPISTISLLTCITEYKVHASLKARRSLFEAQHRRRSIVLVEELREKLSRTVAIFIAVKFLILRSLPILFDIYETFYGIESFGLVLSILVRISDFGVVLNAATNSLAYFGKTGWFEMRLRGRLLKKRQSPGQVQTNETPCSFSLGHRARSPSSNGFYLARNSNIPPSPLTLCKTSPSVKLVPAFNNATVLS